MTSRPLVVDHVLFVVEDLGASRQLYTSALEPLGYRELRVQDDSVHYGVDGMEDFAFAISEGSPVTSNAHVSFAAPDQQSVDAFFDAATSHGASARGRPGRWVQYSDRYYAAFAYDLHGNNIEAVWHAPAPVEEAARRVLATVLLTDIVGSTQHLARIGDREWSALLQRYYASIRQELRRTGGREIDTAGDGFLASFDQPGAGVRCAIAVADAVREMGMEIRAGLHTGECEDVGGKLSGIAVHIAVRVASRARAGQVLVTQTVKDLVAGSELTMEEIGRYELKGVPGMWQLYTATKTS